MNLLIIGAGGVGGFVAANKFEFTADINISGFLDDDPDKVGKMLFGYEVLGPVGSIKDFKKQAVVIGVNKPSIKKNIVEVLTDYEVFYPKLISKHSWISNDVQIGHGSIIYPGCAINHGTQIDKFTIMNMNCAIGHNSKIGAFSSLAPGVNFAGYTRVEKVVEVGIGVSTKQNVCLGKGSIIGGQAMITKDIPEDVVAYGIPANYTKKI